MTTFTRRKFLATTGAAGLSWALYEPLLGAGETRNLADFTFLFLTDTHLQPELNAAQNGQERFRHSGWRPRVRCARSKPGPGCQPV